MYVVNTDGTLSHEATATGRAWARTLRDPIIALLERDEPLVGADRPWDVALSAYSDDALRSELARRSSSVERDLDGD